MAAGPAVDMRIIIRNREDEAVAFTVPIAEFHNRQFARRRARFNQIGPSVLRKN